MVGSTDHLGNRPAYSEPCAALASVAPGGTIDAKAKIHTTDLLGSNGLATSDCTTFAGTSASCPMGAGIVALILQVNPNLSWLEVQYVIAMGSTRHNYDSDWRQNAAGQWVSHNYGWGLLDAARIIEATKKWGDRKIEEKYITKTKQTPSIIQSSRGSSTIFIEDTMKVHHVEVKIWTDHANVANTVIVLTSPGGTNATLAEKHRDVLSKWQGWRFLSRMHWGENVEGNWTLTMSDEGGIHHIQKWTLDLYGDKATWTDVPVPVTTEEEVETNPLTTAGLTENLSTEEDTYFNEAFVPLRTTAWGLGENPLNTMIVGTVVAALFLGVAFAVVYKYYESAGVGSARLTS